MAPDLVQKVYRLFRVFHSDISRVARGPSTSLGAGIAMTIDATTMAAFGALFAAIGSAGGWLFSKFWAVIERKLDDTDRYNMVLDRVNALADEIKAMRADMQRLRT